MEVLERERLRNQGGGSGGLSVTSGNGNDMIGGNGGPGGMGKKSNSTSQLSAAGKNEYPYRKFIECTFCRL